VIKQHTQPKLVPKLKDTYRRGLDQQEPLWQGTSWSELFTSNSVYESAKYEQSMIVNILSRYQFTNADGANNIKKIFARIVYCEI